MKKKQKPTKVQQITIFMFIPGKEWHMTSAEASSDEEMQAQAERFAQMFGENAWTEMRVYVTQPLWQARRGGVQWNSSGDKSKASRGATPSPQEPPI